MKKWCEYPLLALLGAFTWWRSSFGVKCSPELTHVCSPDLTRPKKEAYA